MIKFVKFVKNCIKTNSMMTKAELVVAYEMNCALVGSFVPLYPISNTRLKSHTVTLDISEAAT